VPVSLVRPPDNPSLGFRVQASPDALGEAEAVSGLQADPAPRDARPIAVVGVVRLVERDALRRTLGLDPRAALDDFALIRAAWRRWGTDCPRYLTGDFAFMLWDPAQRTLFGARDQLGIKPLFYDLFDNRLIASDSLESLLAHHPAPPGIDPIALAAWLHRPTRFEHCPTLRERVALLPPAHCLIVDDTNCTVRRYASLEDAPAVRFRRRDDYHAALRDHLDIAVRDALDGEGGFGTHLTGGLDSSVVTALARRHIGSDQALHAFCWLGLAGSPTEESEDQRLIRILAEREGATLTGAPLQTADVLAHVALDPLDRSLTSTLLHESPVQQQAAAAGVRVLLSGWGGDQCVTYRGFGRPTLFNRLRRRLSPQPAGAASVPDVTDRAETYLVPDLAAKMSALTPHRDQLGSAHAEQIYLLTQASVVERTVSWHWAGQRFGIDYRYPMLDIRLVRFMLGLPPELLRIGAVGRDFARQSLAPLLPREIVSYTDKSDPTRSAELFSAVRSAVATLLPQLDTADPDRAAFVDRDQLARDMRRLIDTGEGPTGLILRTLAFLRLKG